MSGAHDSCYVTNGVIVTDIIFDEMCPGRKEPVMAAAV